MDTLEAIYRRHSVRRYKEDSIPLDVRNVLNTEIKKCNEEYDLNIQIIYDDKNGFSGLLSHYGKFDNVYNYIVLIGKKSSKLEEKLGYCGEKIAILAQTLGLNTCFVGLTYNKGAVKKKIIINSDEKLVLVMSIGYGIDEGHAHKSKKIEDVCDDKDMPEWLINGINSALLAPTAINQQSFKIIRENNIIEIKSLGGFYSNVDLGIVKYHFEIGAGINNFKWKN